MILDQPIGIYDPQNRGAWNLCSDGKCMRHGGFVVHKDVFVPQNYDFAWVFQQAGSGQYTLFNYYGGGYYLDFDGTNVRITTNNQRKWTLVPAAPVATQAAAVPPSVTSGTLALWLDAASSSSVATSGGLVTTWTDRSANAVAFNQGGSGAQPKLVTNVLNSLPGVKFSGGQFLQTPSYAAADFGATNTIFFVLSGYTGGLVMYKGPADESWNRAYAKKIWMGDGSTNEYAAGAYPSFVGNSCDYSTAKVAASTSAAVVCMQTTSANSISFYVNGAAVANDNHRLSLRSDSGNFMTIGGPNTPHTSYLTGYVHEILHYSASLSSADVGAVNSYLLNKWGVGGTQAAVAVSAAPSCSTTPLVAGGCVNACTAKYGTWANGDNKVNLNSPGQGGICSCTTPQGCTLPPGFTQ